MKRFCGLILGILLLVEGQSQNFLTGEWTGMLYQASSNEMYQNYFYSFNIKEEKGIAAGNSRISHKDSYAIFNVKGTFMNNIFSFEETAITEEKNDRDRLWCLKSGKLKLIYERDSFFLRGNWTGYFNGDFGGRQNCAPGNLTVKKLAKKITFTGHILDAETKKPVLMSSIQVNNLFVKFTTTTLSDNGNFSFSIPESDFSISVSAKGYLSTSQNISYSATQKDIYLKPVKTGAKVELEHLQFERGSPEISPSSEEELLKLARFMQDNPAVKIRLEGHTSNEGDEKKNIILSEERVKNVKNYLVGKGIAENRISFIGYGPKKPLMPNDTEEHKKRNRRVEFVIVK